MFVGHTTSGAEAVVTKAPKRIWCPGSVPYPASPLFSIRESGKDRHQTDLLRRRQKSKNYNPVDIGPLTKARFIRTLFAAGCTSCLPWFERIEIRL
jgi:hypothetical protein